MKRILLGLAMLGCVAFLATPAANALTIGECGHSYAFQLHGTEPATTSGAALNYIVGIGSISFGAVGTSGPTGCTVTSLEMIYSDNDFTTFSGGPAACLEAESALGGGIPCFDGGDHQNITGSLTFSTFGNGSQTLSIDPSFGWFDGGPAAGVDLPLTFTLQANTGSAIVLGNSVPLPGPSLPTGTPPANPVLVITLQKQSTTVTLPVQGPGAPGNGYGEAPYLGLSISLFEGFGAQEPNLFIQGLGGTFGSTISALQIFSDGLAGGSTSFSSNDNVGNTTGGTTDDCDTTVTQLSNYADGTSNDLANIVHPGINCVDAAAGAAFTLSGVQFGATDTSGYDIVTAFAADTVTAGALVPPALMSTSQSLSSVPPGTITNLVVPTTIVAVNKTATGYMKLTNTSPAGCDVLIDMSPSSASGGGNATCTGLHTPLTCCTGAGTGTCVVNTCTIGQVFVPVTVEGDTPSTLYATTDCTCNGTTPVVSTTSTLSVVGTQPEKVILGASETGNTVTITEVVNPTGLYVGQPVVITGLTPTGFDGLAVVATIPTASTFTYFDVHTGLGTGTPGPTGAYVVGGGIADCPLSGTTSYTITCKN